MIDVELDAVAAAEAIGPPTSFEEWMIVARALAAGRQWAMDEAGTSRPQGLDYGRAFALWLERHPSLDRYTKTMCWAMSRCLERRDEIDAWRARLPAFQRASLVDPVEVLALFRAGDRPAASRGDGVPDPSLESPGLRDGTARLRGRD
jgi:hypothetical protein